ncbi:MAG: hypothetical protein LKK08_06450 [Bacteroidales bacterium]|jgi:hypothetical protein|nr:hypothetical protein [Bacteroidales bacterium]
MKNFKLLSIAISFAVMLAGLSSCNKNGTAKEVDATITFTSVPTGILAYGEPAVIKGNVTCDQAVTGYCLTGMKKEDESYTAVGEEQTFDAGEGGNFELSFFPDNDGITDIEFKAMFGEKYKTEYISISGVEGSAEGSAYLNDQVVLYADTLVWNHENHPDVYQNENTGAGSDTKSFFSIHGVNIGGNVEHMLSLDEMRSVDGLNGSFCFLNCLQNTSNNAYIGSQRGYMFSSLKHSSLAGGTTGRQCDAYEVDGHAINDDNIDYTEFKIIAGSWTGEAYDAAHRERFEFVDSLFCTIKDDTSSVGRMRAFYALSQVQQKLDNATLGVTDNPTSLGSKTYARRYTNAGSSSKSELQENFRAGDYIILRSKRGTTDNPKYYYGIMQIVQIYDDSGDFADFNGLSKLDPDKATGLFLKPLILDVKTQTEF